MEFASFASMNIRTSDMLGNSLVSMDSFWKGKGKGQSLIEESFQPNMPFIPKAAQKQPDWNSIPSKEAKMSDEEFEEAIRALALEDAERGMKMGDARKGISAGEDARSKLLMEYVSAVSPDRKSAYESFNGRGDAIYGEGSQKLMERSAGGTWSYASTKEEQERAAKFSEIYLNAIKEYQDENGEIPIKASSSSSAASQYSAMAARFANSNFYNMLG